MPCTDCAPRRRAVVLAASLAPVSALAGPPTGGTAPAAAPEPAPEALADDAVAAGENHHYKPLHRTRLGSFAVSFPASAQLGAETRGDVPVDTVGGVSERSALLDTVVRVGAVVDAETRMAPLVARLEAEYDVFTGAVQGGNDALLDDRLIRPQDADAHLRRAFARVGLAPFVMLGGGYTVNHWGLGLLANDGVQSRRLGQEGFADPGAGDRVLRAQVSTGPWLSNGLVLSFAYDRVEDDDVLLAGDDATQMVGALVYGYERPNRLGFYAARRHQTAADGQETNVTALDLHLRGELKGCACGAIWRGELEAAYVFGETELGPTTENATHDVAQLGVAARLEFDAHRWGVSTDLVYASGDGNFDDGAQHGFKADPGFSEGLLLFRQVLAAQTARGADRAADPELIGRPSEDLDRFPTRGQLTNTWLAAPQFFVRPIQGLLVHAGPTIAFSDAPIADPRESRLGGGTPRNALGGEPGHYLGTELTLGARQHTLLWGSRLSAGITGAYFLPGSAFDDANGAGMDALFGARLDVRYAL
jgi:hypothetical protein